MYSLGGGGVTALRTELYKGGHTGHRQWSRDHSLFRIRFVVIVAPFCKGRDSIGAPACFTSCSKSTLMQVARNSCCEALVGWAFLSQNWAAKAAASVVDKMSCSVWAHAGCCDPPVRGFLARESGRRVTGTQVSPPDRALFRTKGFSGASGEATARCVNLYEDMVAAC